MPGKCRRTLLVATIVVLSSRPVAFAQEHGDSPPSIRITGHATITTEPDRVVVDVGVVTRAATSRSAASENANRVRMVLDALRKLMGDELTLRTVGYSVRPEHTHPKEGRSPEITGYVASNIVRGTTSELDRVGDLIDAAVAAGANRIERVEFTLGSDESVHAKALREAATRARSDAGALAAALGLKIVRVLSVAEGSTPVRPVVQEFRTATLATNTPDTPVEPGTIEVHASVSLTVEVAER